MLMSSSSFGPAANRSRASVVDAVIEAVDDHLVEKTRSRQIHVSLDYGLKDSSEDPVCTLMKLCGYCGVDKAGI